MYVEEQEVLMPSTSHYQPPSELPHSQESSRQLSSPEISSSEKSSESGPSYISSEDPAFVLNLSDNQPTETEYVNMQFQRVVSTHKYCFVCGSTKSIINAPSEARKQAFVLRRLYIPNGNRCCPTHLIKKRLYAEHLSNLRVHSNSTLIEINELRNYFEFMSIKCDSNIKDKIGDFGTLRGTSSSFYGINLGNHNTTTGNDGFNERN